MTKANEEMNYPEIVVGALVRNAAGKYLLIKSPKWKRWVIPGGHVEFGETIEDAVKREVKEEVGLTVATVQFIQTKEFVRAKEFNPEKHLVGLQYLAQIDDAEDAVILQKEEASEYLWLSAAEIDEKKDVADFVKENIKFLETQKSADDYLSGWKRAQADYQNLKKEMARDKEDFAKYANANLIMELLPTLDNFKLAFKQIPETERTSAWVVGFNHIKGMLEKFLRDNGVEEFGKAGEQFDPTRYDAVEKKHDDSCEDGKILDVKKNGYTLNGKVIQSAKVVVCVKEEK